MYIVLDENSGEHDRYESYDDAVDAAKEWQSNDKFWIRDLHCKEDADCSVLRILKEVATVRQTVTSTIEMSDTGLIKSYTENTCDSSNRQENDSD